MDVDALTNQLRTMQVEEVVAWMVKELGHNSLKTCVRKITNESGSKSASSSGSGSSRRKKLVVRRKKKTKKRAVSA